MDSSRYLELIHAASDACGARRQPNDRWRWRTAHAA